MPYHNLRTDNALNVSPDHVLQGISPFKNLNSPIPGESAALLHAIINLPGGYAPPPPSPSKVQSCSFSEI